MEFGICICLFVFPLAYAVSQKVTIGQTEFSDLIKSPAFVDKTLFLKEILKHDVNLVTAPQGFFKTSNIKMMKSFLSINVDEEGQPISIEKSENFKYFKNLKIFKEEKQFFYKHFGSRPVLHLDLTHTEALTSYIEELILLTQSLHKSFLDHKYLCNSSKLNEEDRKICSDWCHEINFSLFNIPETKEGLSQLVRYLYQHFNNSKVYVLVDGYDSIVTNAMFRITQIILKKHLNFTIEQMSGLFKSNDHVMGGLLSGVFHISGEFSEPDRIFISKFLGNHSLVDFYGFTKPEVDDLLKKPRFNLSAVDIENAHAYYDGFSSLRGTRVYSPDTILNFLISRKVKNFFKKLSYTYDIDLLLKHPQLKPYVTKLLEKKPVPFNPIGSLDVGNITELKRNFNDIQLSEDLDPNLVLNFLLDNGFVCYDDKDRDKPYRLRIPSFEIWECYYIETRMDFAHMMQVNHTVANMLRERFGID